MKRMRSIALGTVFLIGCAVGGISSQFVAPPARAGTNPQRWEYYCIENLENIHERSDKLGAEGWEMVTATAVPGAATFYYMWCFKRPR